MVIASAPTRTISRQDIADWVDSLIDQGKTDQEAQSEVFEEILRDGLAAELLRVLGPSNTVGSICRSIDQNNRPAKVLPGWTSKPVVIGPPPECITEVDSIPIATGAEGHNPSDPHAGPAAAPAAPKPTFGNQRIPLTALSRDTSMLTGRYDVPGIGLVALGEMTKSHCRALADQFLREGRSKLTYAKWFKRLGESLKDETEQLKARWDEHRILNLFELSEPKL